MLTSSHISTSSSQTVAPHRVQSYIIPSRLCRLNEAFANRISASLVHLLIHRHPLWPFHVTAIGSLPGHTPSLFVSWHLSPHPSTSLLLLWRSSVLTCMSSPCSLRSLFFSPLVASPPSCFICPLLWLHPGLGHFLELLHFRSHKIHTSHSLTTTFSSNSFARLLSLSGSLTGPSKSLTLFFVLHYLLLLSLLSSLVT